MQNNQWQSLLQMGNDCYQHSRWQEAEFFYSEAYDLLAFAYRNNPLCVETMMAWICACHNLSSLYENTARLGLALKFLTVPHDYCKSVTEAEKASNEVKLLAIKGLSITLPPILAFANKYPICDDCLSQFQAQQGAATDCPSNMH